MGEKTSHRHGLRAKVGKFALSAYRGLDKYPRVKHVIDHVLEEQAKRLFDIRDPHNFIGQTAERITQESILIIVANHGSHADLVPLAALSQILGDATGRTFLTPFAASVETGDQGSTLQTIFHIAQPALLRHHMEPVPVVRKADTASYGLERSGNGSGRRLLQETSFVWLPEGTVKSSRRDEQGNKYGMQQPPKEFETAMRLLMRSGREIVFLPVGISGSDSVVGPDSRKPSGKALRRLVTPPPLVRAMAQVTVGKPFVLSRDTKPKDTDVRDIIMQHIAPLVPDGIRGKYKF